MRSPGINGEGELRGNRLNQVHLQKWPLKRSVCTVFLDVVGSVTVRASSTSEAMTV